MTTFILEINVMLLFYFKQLFTLIGPKKFEGAAAALSKPLDTPMPLLVDKKWQDTSKYWQTVKTKFVITYSSKGHNVCGIPETSNSFG